VSRGTVASSAAAVDAPADASPVYRCGSQGSYEGDGDVSSSPLADVGVA
jgi:hypothetical protein